MNGLLVVETMERRGVARIPQPSLFTTSEYDFLYFLAPKSMRQMLREAMAGT